VDQVRLDDVAAGGWVVGDPVVDDDGAATFTASKPFSRPDELPEVLAEISGPDGPFADLGLELARPFARTRYRVEGALDGSVGVDAFADPDVAAALGGLPFGRDLAELEGELGGPVGERVRLRLGVSLPGGAEGSTVAADGGVVDVPTGPGGVAVWTTDLAAEAPVPVIATSEELRAAPLAWAGAAAGLVLLALVVLLVGLWRAAGRRRRRRRAARMTAAPTPARAPAPAAGAADDGVDDDAERPALRMVILGAPGVVFGVVDEVEELLVPFARARGSELPAEAIAELHAAACLGRLAPAELWGQLGVDGDPAALDEAYLGGFSLAPGVRDFAERARERGYTVGCVADGPEGWSDHLREVFHLAGLVEPWVATAEVGARPPAIGPIEAVRRTAGVPAASCLVIDAHLPTLDVVRRAGFGTAWSTSTGRAADAPGHALLRGVDGLLGP
jgi:FMN phosphatase YigB (HAD superfamily)